MVFLAVGVEAFLELETPVKIVDEGDDWLLVVVPLVVVLGRRSAAALCSRTSSFLSFPGLSFHYGQPFVALETPHPKLLVFGCLTYLLQQSGTPTV